MFLRGRSHPEWSQQGISWDCFLVFVLDWHYVRFCMQTVWDIIPTCKGARSLSLCASHDGQASSAPLHNPKVEDSLFDGNNLFLIIFQRVHWVLLPMFSTLIISHNSHLRVVPGLEKNPKSRDWPVEGVPLLHCLLVDLLPVGSQHLKNRY